MIKSERVLEKVAYWLLCAIVFDCAALGGGTIIEIFGIDIRMVLFALFFLTSLPTVLRNMKGLLANGYFVLLFLWGVWLIISTARGIAAGNPVDRILSAWIGFASFGLLPGVICILSDKERILKLMKTMVIASAFLAIQSLFALFVYNVMGMDAFWDLNQYMIREELGGSTGVNDAVVRIFFRSHPLMVVGCACSLYFALVEKSKKLQMLHLGNIAICLFSLVISYTRSLYLCVFSCAAAAVLGMCIALDKDGRKQLFKTVMKAVTAFIAFVLVCDILAGAGFVSYGIYRTVGIDVLSEIEEAMAMPDGSLGGFGQSSTETTDPDEDDEENQLDDPLVNINDWSDNIRAQTVAELYSKIAQHPIIGSGMGASLEVREGLDGNNEYFFLDQTFKTGLIGILLYMSPMILMLVLLVLGLHKMETESVLLCIVWLAGLLGIAAFSSLNPYLNGSNGIVLYCCTIGVFSTLNKKQQIELKKNPKMQ